LEHGPGAPNHLNNPAPAHFLHDQADGWTALTSTALTNEEVDEIVYAHDESISEMAIFRQQSARTAVKKPVIAFLIAKE
jgi:hypothetical protein